MPSDPRRRPAPYPRRVGRPSSLLCLLLAAVWACPATASPPPVVPPVVTVDALGPVAWPAGTPVPPEVETARDQLRAARTAERRARLGLEAEVIVAPDLDVVRRDDPPRPPRADLELRPEAKVRWAPLRSEALLARARVLEAEVELLEAWRAAILDAWRLPIERARAEAALRAARAELSEAAEAREAAASHVAEERAARARADPADRSLVAAERTLRDARLDEREARLDLDEARRELAALPTATTARGDPPTDGGVPEPGTARRRRISLPRPAPGWTPRDLRADALRRAADVARSERRRLGAVLPKVGVEIGYAGSDATGTAKLALEHGRPRGELGASLGGTPQERGWLEAYAAVRLGSDAPTRAADLAAVRERARTGRVADAAAWRADLRDARAEVRTREARWRLAEARSVAAHEDGAARAVARADDRARRTYLTYLTAVGKVLDLVEALPPLPPAASDAPPSLGP